MSNSERVESRVAESVTDECIHRHRPEVGDQLILSFRIIGEEQSKMLFESAEDIYSKNHVVWIFSFDDKVLEP